eukprot:8886604-Alexandrium_andersonii.AAC.1
MAVGSSCLLQWRPLAWGACTVPACSLRMVAVALRFALGAAALLVVLSAWSLPALRTPLSPSWYG